MQVLGIVKQVVSGVVGIGASKIVAKVIQNNAIPETLFDKVTMLGGAWAIGGMVAAAAKSYTDEAVDKTAEKVAKQVDKLKESAKLGRIERDQSTFEKEGLDPENYVRHPEKKIWLNRKTYNKLQLMKVNAGKLKIDDAGIDMSLLAQDKDNKWFLLESVENDSDTITLRKNAAGVWEPVNS